jgi:hypothetical protein
MECPVSGEVSFTAIDLVALSDAKRQRLLGDRILWIDRESPPMCFKVCDHVAMFLLMGQ